MEQSIRQGTQIQIIKGIFQGHSGIVLDHMDSPETRRWLIEIEVPGGDPPHSIQWMERDQFEKREQKKED